MWTLNSWKNYKAKHLPEYKNQKHLDKVLTSLRDFPPLVFAGGLGHLEIHSQKLLRVRLFYCKGEIVLKAFLNSMLIT